MSRSTLARASASGLVALALLLTGGAASAASVSGLIKNQANIGLPGVTVEWRNEATAEVQSVTTNANGNYSISVDPATYTVKLTEPASGTVSTVPGVQITGNTTRDFVLILADRLPPMTFSGRVLREDTGGPARNLRMYVYEELTGSYLTTSLYTDDNGDYTFTYQPDLGQTYGRWRIFAYTNYITDRGDLPSGSILVRQSETITGDWHFDYMVRTVTARGTLTRCDDNGDPTNVPVEGVSIRMYMGSYYGTYGYGEVSPVDGTFESTLLQTSLNPGTVRTNQLWIQARALGYCAPYEDEPSQTPPGLEVNTDAYGSADVSDIEYTKCLPVVPLMKTRVVDIDGNPIGNVEIQVYNDTQNKWVVQSGNRYTERDRANTDTYGRACFGVSEGDLRVWFNSRSFDSGNYNGEHFGGEWGRTPAGRWQVNGFTMPSTGLDLGDQEIPTLFLRGRTEPPIPNQYIYAYLRWSSSYGYQQARTDAEGNYDFAIIPSDEIDLPYNPNNTSTMWYLRKTPPFGVDCGGTPCVEDYEVLPQSDTAGYIQGGVSAKSVIRWEPGVAVTGSDTDWDGNPVPLMYMRFGRYDPVANFWWYVYRYANSSNNIQYDYDGDAYNGEHLWWLPAREYRQVYVWMPSYTNFNPRSDAPHVPANRNLNWLSDYLVPASGVVLPWDTRETAHAIDIRVLTSLGLGVPGTVVEFDESYQSGRVFNNLGDVDMYPYGGEAGSPVDPAVQFDRNSWVTVTPPTATGLPSFRLNENTRDPKTLTYIYPVENTQTPNILSVDIVARTEVSLTSQFVADQLVDGIMCCGLDAGDLSACAETLELSETHTLEVVGLEPGTTYECQVCGSNASGADGCSDVFTGTTLDACDEVPPTQANFAYNISDTRINVTWTTNEACQGSVVVDGDPLTVQFEDGLGTSHGIIVDSLAPETEYVLSVSCTDTCGNTRVQTSAVTTLETQTDPDVTPPTCSGVVSDLGETYAIFQISCNEPSTINVQCSDTSTFEIYIGQNNTAAITLPVSVTSLTPGTSYQCGANGIDAFDNQAPFDLPDVTTPATVLPMIITAGPSVSASDTLANITWKTGDAGGNDRAGTTELAYALKDGAGCGDPSTWPAGNEVKNLSLVVDHTVDLNGLQPQSTYCYVVRSVGLNSTIDSAILEFDTLAAPVVLAIDTVDVATLPAEGCSDVLVSLGLSKPAEVILQVSATLRPDGGLLNPITAYGRPAAADHIIRVGGLTPGVTHYYTVLVYDQDGATVRYPATGLTSFSNCGGPPNAPPVVDGTGSGYTRECTDTTGTTVTLTGTVRDPYACTLGGCPGDEQLECVWIDTVTDAVVATALSTGAVAGAPEETQSCSADAVFDVGTHFIRLEAHEQGTDGLVGVSSSFQVLVRDTAAPCVNAGPDVAWDAVASDCTLPGGAAGVLVNVLDLDGDGSDDIAARPFAETGTCGDAAVLDACDAAPAVAVVPAPFDVATYGPYVHCVGYGATVAITYQATDDIGNQGTDAFSVSVADLCTGVDCSALDGDCVLGACNPATGACETEAKPNLTQCDDLDACTVSDVCRDGVCGGAPKCDYLNSAATCRIGVCDPGGVCRAERNPDLSCNHAPTAKCVAYTASLDASGNVTVLAESVAGTSFDADSDEITLSIDPSTFTCADLGANAVTASVSDFALTSTCAATVTVVDAAAPSVTCPSDVAVGTDDGACTAVVSYVDPASADNCGGVGVSLESGLGSGASFPVGSSTESWTATDAGGNTASCSFAVAVSDDEAPTVTCPSDISADNDAGVCGAAVTFASATGADNCAIAGTAQTAGPVSGDVFAVGTTSAEFTTTDTAGLTATCQVAVTVADSELPAIVCPSDVATATDPGECGALVSFADPVTTDNCGGATASLTEGGASGSFFAAGTTPQTFTATDGAGLTTSCGFSVTVSDGEAPSIVCPADVTAGTDDGVCSAAVAYAAPTASDNCGGATVAQTGGAGSGATFALGSHTETFEATDAASNAASCSLQVTVADDEAPSLSCPADVTANTDAGACTAVVAFAEPTASDNCAVASTTQSAGLASGAAFPVGTTSQSYAAADDAGNGASCDFSVTVTDAEAPTATCPADIAVGTDAGQCGAVVTFAEPTGADNCGVASTSLTGGLASGALFPVGDTAQTLAVSDTAGLSDSCGFTVSVSDTEDPTITCPADIVVGDGDGCTAFVSYTAPTGADNCAGATTALTSGIGSDNVFPVGDTVETWTVTDAVGRTASCSFTVTVLNTDGDGDTVPCLDDSNDDDPTVCRDLDGDTCDDCASGTDDVANDGVDLDSDGICDAGDGCIADPNKTAPGICGCNYEDTGDADADGVLDCVDVCPGSDDSVDDDMNGIPDGCDNIAVLVDNDDANNTPGETAASQSGEWSSVAGPPTAYLNDFARSVAGTGSDTATFTAYLPQNGQYAVYATWVAATRNATNAPYLVTEYTGARTTVRVDQTVAPSGKVFDGQELQLLGTFEFRGGVASDVVLSDDADGRVVADAVAFEFIGGITIEETKPELTIVRALDPTTVEVVFAEPVDPKTDATKWEIADAGGTPLVIRGATVVDGTVTLVTDPHTYNRAYELTVNEVYDLFGNLLLTDSWSYQLSAPTVIVDNATSTEPVPHATCTDTSWASKTSDPGYYGNDHQLASNRRFRRGRCTYAPDLTVAGQYTVSARWTDGANRTARAAFTINDSTGATDLAIDQTSGGGKWNDLGVYDFAAGAGDVWIGKGTDSAFVDADAVRFAPVVDLGASGPEKVASSADGAVTLTHNSTYDMWVEPIATPEDGAVGLATAVPALTVVGTAYDIGPSGTYPDGSPAIMTLSYDDADLPPGTDETTLEIHTLNGSVWEPLVTVSRDTDANVIVAEVPHQSVFALLTRASNAVAEPVVATDVTATPDARYDTFEPPATITVSFRLPEPWDVADVALPISADASVDAVSVSSADGVASVAFDGAELLDLLSPNITSRSHTLRGYLRPAGDGSTLDFDRVPFEATVSFDTVTSLKKSKVHFHGSKPYARFEGSLVLTDGQIGADFRSGDDAGFGSVRVTLGDDDLVVYDNPAITYELRGVDHAHRDEKWHFDGDARREDITFRWDTSPEYDAGNDRDLPRSVGELHSEFIHVDETKLELNYRRATLPLTVVIDGIVLATVHEDRSVTSALPFEVHRKKVTVLFPDRLVPGNVVEWYRDGDLSDGVQNLVYTHECAADGTASATYTNGTARFDITVPIPIDIDADALAPTAVLEFAVGEPGVTLVNEALIAVDYRRDHDHGDRDWKYNDRAARHGHDDDDRRDDDDDHDHGHCRGRH